MKYNPTKEGLRLSVRLGRETDSDVILYDCSNYERESGWWKGDLCKHQYTCKNAREVKQNMRIAYQSPECFGDVYKCSICGKESMYRNEAVDCFLSHKGKVNENRG